MKHKSLKNLFVILVFIFLYLPILILIIYSFNSSKMNILFHQFTFEWYKKLFTNRDLLEAFFNTMIIAITSTSISVIVGTLSAVGLHRYDFPLKSIVLKLIYIPIVIPEIVLGISLLSVYTLMKLELGMFTLILSHIAFSIPFVIVSVRANLSPALKSIEEAAKDLGASEIKTFFLVTLPYIKPGVVSGATLALTLSLDDVVISYFTAGPGSNTLPLHIYSMIKTGITPDVNALSTLMLLFTVVFLLISTFVQARKVGKYS